MDKSCRICRWGPRQNNCLRPHCDYEVIKNGELVRRLTDEQLVDFLTSSPIVTNEGFWKQWIEKSADNELLRRFYAE